MVFVTRYVFVFLLYFNLGCPKQLLSLGFVLWPPSLLGCGGQLIPMACGVGVFFHILI